MLFNPTERNVNPFLFQTGIRTVKKLVLTLAIHDKNVTIAKTAQVSFTVRTGLALPLEDSLGAEADRHGKLLHPRPTKQWLVIAMPPHTRLPSPVKVQVHGGRRVSLSTPRLHQGSDSPPHLDEQWPAPRTSMWPDSCAASIRV